MYSGVLAERLEPELRRLLIERSAGSGSESGTGTSTSLGGDDFTLFASARIEPGPEFEAKIVVGAGSVSEDMAIYISARVHGRAVPPAEERMSDNPDLALRVATVLSEKLGGREVRQEDGKASFFVPLTQEGVDPST